MRSDNNKPVLSRVYDRVNTDKNDHLDRTEVDAYLGELGVSQAVKSKAVDRFMDMFSADGERVSWDDFVKNGKQLLPPGLTNDDGELDPGLVDTVFERISGGQKDVVDVDDVTEYALPQVKEALPWYARSFAKPAASALAKVAVDALDRTGDETFEKKDLAAALDEINDALGIH